MDELNRMKDARKKLRDAAAKGATKKAEVGTPASASSHSAKNTMPLRKKEDPKTANPYAGINTIPLRQRTEMESTNPYIRALAARNTASTMPLRTNTTPRPAAAGTESNVYQQALSGARTPFSGVSGGQGGNRYQRANAQQRTPAAPSGATWEDENAAARGGLTPRQSYAQLLQRNMDAAASGAEVTPQMQAELQNAYRAESEYKARKRQQTFGQLERDIAANMNPYAQEAPAAPERKAPADGVTEQMTTAEVKEALPGLQEAADYARDRYQKIWDRNVRIATDQGQVPPEMIAELWEAERDKNETEQRLNLALARNEELSYGDMLGNTKTDLSRVGELQERLEKVTGAGGSTRGMSVDQIRTEQQEVVGALNGIRASLRAEGYSDEEITALFGYLRRERNAENAKAMQEEARAAAAERGSLGNLAINTGTGLLGGAGYIDLAMQNLFAGQDAVTGQRARVDYNSPAQSMYQIGEATMQGEMDKLLDRYGVTDENGNRDFTTEGKIRAGAYQLTASMGQSATVAGLTAMGVPCAMLLLSGNAATQTTHEMHEKGYSDGTALLMGGIAGAAEYVTEKIGMDELFKTRDISTAKNLLRGLLHNQVNQAMAEGGEEVLSTVINTLADLIVNGDKNELETRYREFLSAGYTPEQAEKAAAQEWLGGVWQDFYMGALSGLLFGGAGTAIQSASNAVADTRTGKTILSEGTANALIDEIGALDSDIAQTANVPAVDGNSKARQLGAAQRGLERARTMENMRAELEARGEENVTPALLSGLYASSQRQEQRLTGEEKRAMRGSETAQELAEEWAKQWKDGSVPAPFAGAEDVLRERLAKRNKPGEDPSAQDNTAGQSGPYATIETLPDGRKYVKADREVIYGNDPDSWGEQITNYINGKIRKGEDVPVITEDGDTLFLTEDTAGKAAFRNRVESGGGRSRPMTDDEYNAKINAEAHIDELSEISEMNDRGRKPVPDHGGLHDFAKDGWKYRTVFFRDFDGKYYKITLSTGLADGKYTVYNVGVMDEAPFPTFSGSDTISGRAGNRASTGTIQQTGNNGNNNFEMEGNTNGESHIDSASKNRNDGIRAGEQGRTAGTGEGTQPGGQSEVRQGLEQSDVEDLRGQDLTPAELGIRNGSDTGTVHVQTREEMSDRAREAEDLAQSFGYTSVPVTGELGFGNGLANAVIQDGVIYFRTDATYQNGDAIDPVSIIEHEITHPFTEDDADRRQRGMAIIGEYYGPKAIERMRNNYRNTYKDIYDFEHMTVDEITAAIENEMFGDAYSGMNAFRNNEGLKEEMQKAFPEIREGQNQTEESENKTRGPPEGRALAVDRRGNVVVDEEVDQNKLRSLLESIEKGVEKRDFTFPVKRFTPRIYVERCHLDAARSLVMHSGKAAKTMRSGGKNHGLGSDGLMKVIDKIDTPDYIIYETEGDNAGHYVAIVTIDDGETVAAIDFGGYRRGTTAAVNGENGYYDALITAYNTLEEGSPFETFEEYIDALIENNDVVYDRAAEEEKNKEDPEPVGLSESLSRQASESSENKITDFSEKSNPQNGGRASAEVAAEDIEAHKKAQWEIIQEANPMRDDIHAGIRSADEIHTFQEALEEDGIGDNDAPTPDFSSEMVQEALRTGEITVYSSKPIQAGGFVTPSAMEARNYAGNGRIYSQTVSISDVAWLDSTQGQYAPAKTPGRASTEVSAEGKLWIDDGTSTQDMAKAAEEGRTVAMENGSGRIEIRKTGKGKYAVEFYDRAEEAYGERASSTAMFRKAREAAEYADAYRSSYQTALEDAELDEARSKPESGKPKGEAGTIPAPFAGTETTAAEDYNNEVIRQKKAKAAEVNTQTLRERIRRADEELRALRRLDKTTELTEAQKAHKADVQETLEIMNDELERRKAQAKANRGKGKTAKEKPARAVESMPTKSARDARLALQDMFSTRRGAWNETGKAIDEKLAEIARSGRISEESRQELFDILMDNGAVYKEAEEVFRNIRDTVRGSRLYVSEHDRHDFGDNWDSLRKKAFAAGIYLTNDITDQKVDSLVQELGETFGENLFPQDEALSDMLNNLIERSEQGRNTWQPLSESIEDEAKRYREDPQEIFDSMWEQMNRTLQTFAEKADLEIDLKERSAAQLAEERKRWEDRMERRSRARLESEIRGKVLKGLQRLARAKNKTAPDTKAQIEEVLKDIDTQARQITPAGLEDLQGLYRAYEDAKKDAGYQDDENMGNWIPNPYVEERLARLTQKHVNDMSISEVIELGRTVAALEHSIATQNQMLGEEWDRTITEEAYNVRREVEAAKGAKAGFLHKWAKEEHLSPRRFLEMLGGWTDGTMKKLSHSLEEGQTRMLDFQRRATQSFDSFLSKKENRKWLEKASGKKAEWTKYTVLDGMDEDGGSYVDIELTPMMKISLYLHSRNMDNLRHIQTGGLVIPNKELYRQGKIAEAYAQGQRVKMNPETVRKIAGELTATEKTFANHMTKVFDEISKDAINEVSLQLDGFERAGVDNYMPIETARQFIKSDVAGEARAQTVEGIGSIANERIHASNPIVLSDASDVLMRQIDKVSRYYGYAIPIRNFQAVNNYVFHKEGNAFETSVKELMDRKWGAGAEQYITKMLEDLQSNGRQGDMMSSALAKLRGNLAGATLMFNPSVALSQVASYPGAAQVVGWDGLAAGLTAGKVDTKLMEKYTPLYWYRNQGNSTQELGDYMKDKGLEAKLPWILNWIQKMDSATIRRLWAASEYRVRKDNPGLKPGSQTDIDAGTDAYYKAVAEVFNRAVYDTQPNYTNMERAQILRSKSDVTRFLTMYKTVPLQYYGMMVEASGRLEAARKAAKADGSEANQEALRKAQKYAVNTYGGLLAANAAYVTVKALFKGLRGKDKDYRDEEGKLTAGSVSRQLGRDLLETYAGSIIGGAEALDVADSLITGSKFYGPEMSALSYVEDMVNAVQSIVSAAQSGDPRKAAKAAKDGAETLAQGFGVPAKNLETYTIGIIGNLWPEVGVEYANMFGGIDRSNLKGMDEDALGTAAGLILSGRTGEKTDRAVSDELARLYAAGETVAVPTATPQSFSYNGTTVQIRDRGAYSDTWGGIVNDCMEPLMASQDYLDADDSGKASLINRLYEYATVQARKGADSNYTAEGNSTYGWTVKADEAVEAGVPVVDTICALTAFSGMTADKDENGNSISGSKKAKVCDYIDEMDITDEQKDVMYLLAGYKENSLEYTPWHGYVEEEGSGSGKKSGSGKGSKSGRSGGRRRGSGGSSRAVKAKSLPGVGVSGTRRSAGANVPAGNTGGRIQGDVTDRLLEIIDKYYDGNMLAAAFDGGRKARSRIDFEI